MTTVHPGRGRAVRRTVGAVAALDVLLLASAGPADAAGTGPAVRSASRPEPPRRVLILSVPRLTWAEVVAERPRAILSLLDRSAVASMSLRTSVSRTRVVRGVARTAGSRPASTRRRTVRSLTPRIL